MKLELKKGLSKAIFSNKIEAKYDSSSLCVFCAPLLLNIPRTFVALQFACLMTQKSINLIKEWVNWILPRILEMSLIHGFTHMVKHEVKWSPTSTYVNDELWELEYNVPSKYTRKFHQLLYIEEDIACVWRPFQDLIYIFARQVGVKVHKILYGLKENLSPISEIVIFKKNS
jgi:hypothetical protein